jgi:hypothetical protein
VATAFVALRAGDGRNANVPYFFRFGPGEYQLTPGAPSPPIAPLTPWVGEMKTFAIRSATQFRADGPPDLTSPQWAEDFNEVKAYGALTGSIRTSRQTEIGQFYAEHPPNQFHRNVRWTATAYGFSLADTARFYAQVYVTTADALITVWNSKYFFNFWRPVTAIREADFDDNPDTEADLSWLPLVTTPAHPEYPAAHGAVSGGLAYALEHFFGTTRVVVHVNKHLRSRCRSRGTPFQEYPRHGQGDYQRTSLRRDALSDLRSAWHRDRSKSRTLRRQAPLSASDRQVIWHSHVRRRRD